MSGPNLSIGIDARKSSGRFRPELRTAFQQSPSVNPSGTHDVTQRVHRGDDNPCASSTNRDGRACSRRDRSDARGIADSQRDGRRRADSRAASPTNRGHGACSKYARGCRRGIANARRYDRRRDDTSGASSTNHCRGACSRRDRTTPLLSTSPQWACCSQRRAAKKPPVLLAPSTPRRPAQKQQSRVFPNRSCVTPPCAIGVPNVRARKRLGNFPPGRAPLPSAT